MSEWRTIDSAPKDGTDILLFFKDEGVIQGRWYVGKRKDGTIYSQEWKIISLSSHGCGCCSSDNDEPTHWMPLPVVPV